MLDKLNEGNNKQKLDRILEKLELYYPEHKVFALDSIDKQLRENISNFSSSLGFQFPSEFLEQLGYTMIKGEEVKNLRNKVIYAPGNEPEGIKNKVNNILNRLNEYYPDKEINKGLQKEHKALSLSISGMYQWLGYESIKSFLETYGYNYNIDSEVGGRPSNDYNELIEYLVSKYSNNPMYSSVLDLIANEPEYSSKLNEKNNILNNSLSNSEKVNLRYRLIEFAKQFIGNPYVYGGTSLTKGTDCSGFTQSVYANFGYSLPRSALSQAVVGKQVTVNSLLPGDLIVYHYANGGGHVGIYLGDNKMIHAGTEKTGIVIANIFSGTKTYHRVIY